jgi:hypothetical protein
MSSSKNGEGGSAKYWQEKLSAAAVATEWDVPQCRLGCHYYNCCMGVSAIDVATAPPATTEAPLLLPFDASVDVSSP